MLNLKITKTYSISKLLRNFDNLIDKTLAASAKDTEEASKMNIDSSYNFISDTAMQPLAAATKKVRAEGYYWEGKTQPPDLFGNTKVKLKENLTNKGGDMPLLYTGNLYNSIKAKDKKLSMAGYGAKHNKGYQRTFAKKKKRIPARPFIEFKVGDKAIKTFKDLLKKYLKK